MLMMLNRNGCVFVFGSMKYMMPCLIIFSGEIQIGECEVVFP